MNKPTYKELKEIKDAWKVWTILLSVNLIFWLILFGLATSNLQKEINSLQSQLNQTNEIPKMSLNIDCDIPFNIFTSMEEDITFNVSVINGNCSFKRIEVSND